MKAIKSKSSFKFIVRFLSYLSIGTILLLLLEKLSLFRYWLLAITSINAALLGLVLPAKTDHGTMIHVPNFAMEIDASCSGLFPLVLLAACFLSFPYGEKKGRYFVAAIPLMVVVNIFRLVTLGIAGSTNGQLFTFLHLYVWPSLLVLTVSFFWVYWLRQQHP